MAATEPDDRRADIPDEWAKKAGEAVEDAALRYLGRDLGTLHRDDIARAAIDAVAGDIRKQALLDAADAMDDEGGWETPQWWLRARAEDRQ